MALSVRPCVQEEDRRRRRDGFDRVTHNRISNGQGSVSGRRNDLQPNSRWQGRFDRRQLARTTSRQASANPDPHHTARHSAPAVPCSPRDCDTSMKCTIISMKARPTRNPPSARARPQGRQGRARSAYAAARILTPHGSLERIGPVFDREDSALFDHDSHDRRALTSYSVYYNETHLGLGRDAPL